jgi:hypothetical protein
MNEPPRRAGAVVEPAAVRDAAPTLADFGSGGRLAPSQRQLPPLARRGHSGFASALAPHVPLVARCGLW